MLAKLFRLSLVSALILAGVWLLSQSATMQAEGPAREHALSAMAPAGEASTGDTVGVDTGSTSLPTVVNLRDIPAGVYDPNNQFDRWQRGEIDIDESESIVGEALMAQLQAEALKLPPSGQVSLAGPGTNAPTPSTNFDSMDYTECCGGGGNVPPDPELAVGPNHVIAVVNVAFEIYNKSGVSLAGPTTFASFMNANPNCTGVFDPNVLYDEEADRYILGIDADGKYYCIAVSQTGDPLGSWNLYAFSTASRNDFFDYPHAGVGQDAIYMGANIFKGNNFKEGRVWAFDKWAMYNGQATASRTVGLGVNEDTPQPLNLHGYNQGTWPTSGPHYIVTETGYDGANHTVFAWADPFGANTFSTVGTFNLNTATGVTAGMPVNTPQLGGSTMQANDWRPQDFEYRNGYAWTVMTIACNPGGGTVNCVRWAKINPATATVVDAGVYGSSGEYRTFADLAVNACDDMAVGYTKSGSSMFPGIWYTGRLSTDPAGTLQAEAQLKAGEIAYTAFDPAPRRWGDYTEMTIAPDGVTFWYLGQYSKDTGTTNGRWGTYIGSFSYGCDAGDPPPTPTPTPTGEPPTPTPTATATPPAGDTMHVSDLDGSSTSQSGRWTAFVTISVEDENGSPVAGATVSGSWSNGVTGNANCVTNGSGQCTVSKNNIRNNFQSVTFTVTNVSAGGYTYDAGANSDPDGDSNGTVINVSKP